MTALSRLVAPSDLSYANPRHSAAKRLFIRSVEHLSGRERYIRLYEQWRREILPTGERVFGRMLDLIDVRLRGVESWPPATLPDAPLVIVANHPFGIGDGIAVLALAEQLGRPFRVMINAELLKIREMEPYSLAVDFGDGKEALRSNLAVRQEALRLLKEGVTIVVFPAGAVATAPRGLGPAEDFPWKLFPARLIQEARATVLPVHFAGQNGRLFHLASQKMHLAESRKPGLKRLVGNLSLTVRTSLLLYEFTRLSGRAIDVTVGEPLPWAVLEPFRDRRALMDHLRRRVFELPGPGLPGRASPAQPFQPPASELVAFSR